MGRSDQARELTPRRRLLRLTVVDFGLIARAEFAFGDGLTVFTGETGSGKTMLLGALRFVLGGRAESDLVRGGAERARVVLEVEPDAALRDELSELGVALESDDDLVLGRELTAGGRSQARINGVPVAAGQVRTLAARLVDIVGQHESQRLLAPGFALEIVDGFAGSEALAVRDEVRRLSEQLQAARERLAALRSDDGRALAQLEFARFALAEIDGADPRDGEDEALRERRDVLANAERIGAALAAATGALDGDGGAVDGVGSAAAALAGIARFGLEYGSLAEAARALQSDAAELGSRIARAADRLEGDPAELEAVTGRLDRLDRLKKKYGGSLAAVLAARADFARSVEHAGTHDERLAAAARETDELAARLDARARILTERRRAAAGALEERVAGELGELAMPAARFSVALEPLERIGPGGAERAEFRLAPNPGEPQRPLAKSASGGELSRVLLALMVASADGPDRTGLIFDEIDAGIGGATAVAVGSRVSRLARQTQVVVITHLAQIASWAGAHYALRKREVDGATVIELDPLDRREARLAEIARMLSGDANPVSLEHAATLVAGTAGG